MEQNYLMSFLLVVFPDSLLFVDEWKMSIRKKATLTLNDVLDQIDLDNSDFEGLSSEDEDDVDDSDIISNGSHSDDDVDDAGAGGGSDDEWSDDDYIPLANVAANQLTPAENYKWRKQLFTPPPNTEFRGNTDLPELPKSNHGEVTPYTLFKLFVTTEMLQDVATESNRYSVETTGVSINTTANDIEQVIGMYFYMGLAKMPNVRVYWESETKYEPVCGVMARDRFLKLLRLLHFQNEATATEAEKLDKLWKLRKWCTALRDNFLQIPPYENQSVDEIIVPFKGRSALRVYMPKKPHKWGFKLWGRSSSNGFIHDFDIYQPAIGNVQSDLSRSSAVVDHMASHLPAGMNYKLFADNYFTSVRLIEKLKKKDIYYIGTVRLDRLKNIEIDNDKVMRKKGRGAFVSRVEEKTNVICTRWHDNKVVSLVSSYVGTDPVSIARRWDKKEKQFLEVTRPAIVTEYNRFMGGIDLLNMCSGLYRFPIRSHRWYLYVFYHTLRMALVNAWFVYKRFHEIEGTPKNQVMKLRTFQAVCAQSLTTAGRGKKRARGRPTAEEQEVLALQSPPCKRRSVAPVIDSQKDEYNHFPVYDAKRQRCKLCPRATSMFSHVKCLKCNVYLCLNKDRNCFLLYHK